MNHDDILTAFKSAQNPVLNEIFRIDDLTGRGELQRIARETQQSHWAAPALADLRVSSMARTALDADFSARDYMERFSVAGIAATQCGALGEDVFAAIERDFNQLPHAAVALDPLQNLAHELAASLNSSLTLAELQDDLDSRRWISLDAGWVREYQSLAAMIDANWDRGFPAENVDDDDNLDVGDAEEADAGVLDDGVQVELVWTVALNYTLPAIELDAHLSRLAGRIDPQVHGREVSWERMILAIGRAYPTHAKTLMLLTYPLLQALDLVKAPRGPQMNGRSESLGLDAVERFKDLTFAMIGVLKEIENEC